MKIQRMRINSNAELILENQGANKTMAAFDGHLKIDGIDGESQHAKHKGEIQLESFSWGVSNGGTFASGGGGGAGKAVFQDLHCTAKVSKASPKLFVGCATGEHIKKAVLVLRKAGGDQECFYTVTLSDILISSYQDGGSGGGDHIPTDQFSLNFAKIEYEYKEQKADGTTGGAVKAGYDLKKSAKV